MLALVLALPGQQDWGARSEVAVIFPATRQIRVSGCSSLIAKYLITRGWVGSSSSCSNRCNVQAATAVTRNRVPGGLRRVYCCLFMQFTVLETSTALGLAICHSMLTITCN